MGAQASNNFCEDLVNGSNPRYTYSQQTPDQQVEWQVKKEEEARKAQISENIRKNEAENRARLSQPYQHPPSTYRPIIPEPVQTPSFSPSITTSTYVSSYDTYSYDVSSVFDKIPSEPIRFDTTSSSLPEFKFTNW